jgi:hypothetical protein
MVVLRLILILKRSYSCINEITHQRLSKAITYVQEYNLQLEIIDAGAIVSRFLS